MIDRLAVSPHQRYPLNPIKNGYLAVIMNPYRLDEMYIQKTHSPCLNPVYIQYIHTQLLVARRFRLQDGFFTGREFRVTFQHVRRSICVANQSHQ